jgi:fructokinase
MTSLAHKTVIGIGEVLWDCFADSRRPGGAPANVAFHACQLGHDGVICSRVGDDDLGRELLQHIADHGLKPDTVQVDPDHPTGRVTVDTSDPGRPSFIIHENVAWDFLAVDGTFEHRMSKAAAVCFGTLAQRNEQSRATIHHGLAAASHALIVYDVNLRQAWFEKSWIEQSLNACHVVKLNIDEVVLLTELLDTGSSDPLTFARVLADRYQIQTTCITRAEDGCVLIEENESVDLPGIEVAVADAVGAGDAFTAALISGRLRGWPLRASAAFANEVGALVAGRAGAMPTIREELKELVDRVLEK